MILVTIVIFLAGSAIELFGLLQMSSSISTLNTISIIMLSFLVGVVVARSYGKEFLEKIQWHLKSRTRPSEEVLNGAVMVFASYMLITPGPISDVVGLFILIPATRDFFKGFTLSWVNRKIANGELYFFFKD
jgi:UPF0716 protein FxsA